MLLSHRLLEWPQAWLLQKQLRGGCPLPTCPSSYLLPAILLLRNESLGLNGVHPEGMNCSLGKKSDKEHVDMI